VIKGGSHISDKDHIRIATRLYGGPHVKTPNTGIRCARDL
jgi:formylglycine-generating enzyme required for sulfatase activity